MSRLSQAISLFLVAQLILSPCITWGQGARGSSGARGGGGKAPGVAEGLQGAAPPKIGVSSLTPVEEQLPGGQALSRAVVADKYILGPGDGLTVNLWGEYDEKYEVRVTPDGKISLPTIGNLQVKGISLAEAEVLIESQVKRYYRNVKSGVSLTAVRVFEVLVLGEVFNPGTSLATPVKRVSEVVAQAGGVLPGGSKRYIQVRRNGQVFATADVTAFLRQGDESLNPFLQDGDVIFVPPMGTERISVYTIEVSQGAVGTNLLTETSVPRTVEVKEGERLASIITELGGVSPWWDLEGVVVQRKSRVPEGTMRILVDLRQYYLEKDESQNVVLMSGDEVFVPTSVRRILVAGSVGKSGMYMYIPGKSADEYVAQAGGLSLAADVNRSFIRRADGTVQPYLGVAELNNGDSIIIMEKLFKTWQDYFALVGTVSGVILGLVGFYAAFTNFGR